jgi:hypothetical protein
VIGTAPASSAPASRSSDSVGPTSALVWRGNDARYAGYDIPTPWNTLTEAPPRSAALIAFGERHDAAEFDSAITEADLVA